MLNKLLRLLILISGFLLTVWTVVFHSYYTALLLILGSFPFIPVRLKRKQIKPLSFLFFIAITLLSYRIPVNEINTRIEKLASKSRDVEDLHLFSFRDKAGIYGLNILMSICAYPIYPEISKETFMMMFNNNGKNRRYNSDFALNSTVIKNEINHFNKSLNNLGDNKSYYTKEKRIYWHSDDYKFGSKEARYALALNPSYAEFSGSKIDNKWYVKVVLKVECKYPRDSYVTLIPNPELRIEEGLFWVLQEEGWLHPYTAEWIFEYSYF